MIHHQGKILIGVVIMLISGCAEMGTNAPIDDRTELRDRKPPKPKPAEPQIADAPGFYTVKKGDNLMKISLQFNQNWRDIVDWNTLSNPNDIKVGQVLRIVPPEGAQLAAVPVITQIEIVCCEACGDKFEYRERDAACIDLFKYQADSFFGCFLGKANDWNLIILERTDHQPSEGKKFR